MPRRHRLIVHWLLLTVMLLPLRGLAKEPDIAIQFDPNTPNAAVWLGYLLSRVAYRTKHKLPVAESGVIVPTFDEEVDARTGAATIYQELKEKDKGLRDGYWETLSQVKSRGFMNAYVWTYLRQARWPVSQQPKNLAAFQAWSRSNLKNHKAITYGALGVATALLFSLVLVGRLMVASAVLNATLYERRTRSLGGR